MNQRVQPVPIMDEDSVLTQCTVRRTAVEPRVGSGKEQSSLDGHL